MLIARYYGQRSNTLDFFRQSGHVCPEDDNFAGELRAALVFLSRGTIAQRMGEQFDGLFSRCDLASMHLYRSAQRFPCVLFFFYSLPRSLFLF